MLLAGVLQAGDVLLDLRHAPTAVPGGLAPRLLALEDFFEGRAVGCTVLLEGDPFAREDAPDFFEEARPHVDLTGELLDVRREALSLHVAPVVSPRPGTTETRPRGESRGSTLSRKAKRGDALRVADYFRGSGRVKPIRREGAAGGVGVPRNVEGRSSPNRGNTDVLKVLVFEGQSSNWYKLFEILSKS